MGNLVWPGALLSLALPLRLPVFRPHSHFQFPGDRRARGRRLVESASPRRDAVASLERGRNGGLVPNGVLDTTTDKGIVQSWFGGRSWNVGIATGKISGIVALDCDPRHGGDQSLAALIAEQGPSGHRLIFNMRPRRVRGVPSRSHFKQRTLRQSYVDTACMHH